MNCLCNLFDDNNVVWIVIIALIVLCCFCNQNEGVGRSCR